MSAVLDNIQRLLVLLCHPSPSSYKNDSERKSLLRQNTNILLALLTGPMLMAFFVPMYQSSNLTIKIIFFSGFLNTVVFLCIGRTYPRLFKCYIFFQMTVCSPITLYYVPDSIIFNSIAVHIIPLIMLHVIGPKAYIVELIAQSIYLKVFYTNQMMNILERMSLEEFTRRFINASLTALIWNYTLVRGTRMALINEGRQNYEDSLKLIELERQKAFLLSFSHEIRNLINSMIGSIQLSMLETIPLKVKDLLYNAEVCAEMLIHLVNNILDTGKIEIGELEINPTHTVINETLEKVWAVCAQLIKAKNLKGKMSVQNQVPYMLNIDSYRLTQILLNLIGNSIKFTEKGSINIIIEWIENNENIEKCFEPRPFDDMDEGLFEKSKAFQVINQSVKHLGLEQRKLRHETSEDSSTASQKGILKLIVTDSGSGIFPDKLSKLFSKFGQGNEDPSIRRVGTGLGLFITKQLVERMGGQIKAFSKIGQGTVFIACIPCATSEVKYKAPVLKHNFTEMVKSMNLNAMIVDDIGFNRFFLEKMLTKLGVNIKAMARNGAEAVEKYKANVRQGKSFDIVTMDVDMPVMDGKRAMQLIREFEKDFNLKPCLLIMVSGNCSESEISACVDTEEKVRPEKADLFLKKPASIEDFMRAIKRKYKLI